MSEYKAPICILPVHWDAVILIGGCVEGQEARCDNSNERRFMTIALNLGSAR